MNEAHHVRSPMVSSCKLSKSWSADFSDPTIYRSVIGALQYAILNHLDVSYAVN